MDTITREIVRQFCGKDCTLDCEPAIVKGGALEYAKVATVRPYGPSVEFSWHTVNRVMRHKGGHFRT